MTQKQNAREAAIKAVAILQKAGYVAYLAGGCVRDRLLGREPKDYDIATNARPEQVAELFHKTMKVGEAFGVMLVRLAGHQIEVATFRSDGDYSDGRRPDTVTYTTAEEDAMRRDFTINGLFENPLDENAQASDSSEIIDFIGGREDLATGLIRAIGDPQQRFKEDYLRMLRAVRFASRYQFRLAEETADAIRKHADKIARIASERIGQEMRLMLTYPDVKARAMAATLMESLNLIDFILPDLKGQTYFRHRMSSHQVVGHLQTAVFDFGLSMAAWLLEAHVDELNRLQSQSGPKSQERNDPDLQHWPVIAETFKQALCFSNDEASTFQWVLSAIPDTLKWRRYDKAQKKRLVANLHWQAHWDLLQAVEKASGEKWDCLNAIRQEIDSLIIEGVSPAPLVSGKHLIEMGLRPGPDFKRLLDQIYDAQLKLEIDSESAGVSLARRLIHEM